MKTKCFALLVLVAAFWGTGWVAYQLGFTQGYSHGSRDEFYSWKQVPTAFDKSWDGKLTGRRDAHLLLGGKTVPQSVRGAPPTFELDTQTGKVVRKG